MIDYYRVEEYNFLMTLKILKYFYLKNLISVNILFRNI